MILVVGISLEVEILGLDQLATVVLRRVVLGGCRLAPGPLRVEVLGSVRTITGLLGELISCGSENIQSYLVLDRILILNLN